MIQASNLTKFFGEKCAINNVSFEVEKGEILGFLGPNAAGKTTTMRILTGYFPPSAGTAKIAGFDILDNSLDVRKKVGYLPENFPLYKEMTVTEFLTFVAEVKAIPHVDREKSVKSALEKCGLSHEAENYIGRLSKGYCQRVGIAQALINEPDVLILDEPTVGLDPNQIIEIRNLIKSLAGKSTVILSSHILPEVSMTCSRVIIINKGEIITMDTPENLSNSLQKVEKVHIEVEGPLDQIKSLLGEVKGVLKIESAEVNRDNRNEIRLETERNPRIRREIASLIVGKDFGLYELSTKQLTLEEIFIQMTEKGGPKE